MQAPAMQQTKPQHLRAYSHSPELIAPHAHHQPRQQRPLTPLPPPMTDQERRDKACAEYKEIMDNHPAAPSQKHFKFSQLSAGREYHWDLHDGSEDADTKKAAKEKKAKYRDPEERFVPQGLGYGDNHRQHFGYLSQQRPARKVMSERIKDLREQQAFEAKLQAQAQAEQQR